MFAFATAFQSDALLPPSLRIHTKEGKGIDERHVCVRYATLSCAICCWPCSVALLSAQGRARGEGFLLVGLDKCTMDGALRRRRVGGEREGLQSVLLFEHGVWQDRLDGRAGFEHVAGRASAMLTPKWHVSLRRTARMHAIDRSDPRIAEAGQQGGQQVGWTAPQLGGTAGRMEG